ncbi:hypothetical protein ACTXG6_36055 [Pseudonocardia sp. Cha107L01]|uniref:hypothetical protein n=1 Tax=Pseudonocardia sp. Cha107L01 TaxID=3457576 RepID=UPI00403EF2D0
MFGPAYAGAALLIRETVRRRGPGWGSVLLFGTAYGLAEEGLALQSLTSTGMYPVADWAPRVAGINTAYTVMVLPYHAVLSIALPILMVDLLFPRHRGSPYLRTRGLICSALALISTAPTRRTLPTPAVIALCAGAAVALYLGLLIPMPGATHSAYTEGHQQWLPLLAVPAAAAAATLAVRPFARLDWTNAQRAALLGGALVAHTAIGLLTYPHTTTDRVGLATLGLLEAATAVLLVRQNRAA